MADQPKQERHRPPPPAPAQIANHVREEERRLVSTKERVEEILLLQSLTTGRGRYFFRKSLTVDGAPDFV
jgi:hypothetical protein